MASFSRLRPETAALAPHSTTMTTLQSRPVAWHVFLYGINFFKDLLIRTHDNTLVASIWHRFRPQKMSLVALPLNIVSSTTYWLQGANIVGIWSFTEALITNKMSRSCVVAKRFLPVHLGPRSNLFSPPKNCRKSRDTVPLTPLFRLQGANIVRILSFT